MKNSQTLIIGIIGLVILILIAVYGSNKRDNTNVQVTTNGIPSQEQVENIEGCYVASTGQDIYTLRIASQSGNNVSGNLSFKNYQKDSSSGTFNGTYENGILLGDYSFASEGTNSVMEVVFKKYGDNFVRGYGDLNSEGTVFTNLDSITYDDSSSLSVFYKEACPQS
jgi:hypothetical protein